MELTLPLINPRFDDESLPNDFDVQMGDSCQITMVEYDLLEDPLDDEHIFALWLEYGPEKKNTFMFEVKLCQLELFASSLLRRIEMIRRDYADEISLRRKNGLPI